MLIINGSTEFQPVTGTEDGIAKTEKRPGYFYVASDSGRMYLDVDNDTRISVGGSGVSILYGDISGIEDTDVDEFGYYHLPLDGLVTEDARPQLGDLIINTDGCFYKIEEFNDDVMLCNRIMVSGSGTGGGGGSSQAKKIFVDVENLSESSNLINGQDAFANLTVHSGIDVDGSILDPTKSLSVIIIYSVRESGSTIFTEYYRDTNTITDLDDGQTYKNYNFGSHLRDSSTVRVSVIVEGPNSGTSKEKAIGIFTTTALSLTLGEDFSNKNVFKPNELNLTCNAQGNIERIVDVYWDNELLESRVLKENDPGRNIVFTPKGANVTHNYHTVRFELYQYFKNERRLGVAPIEFEVGVNTGEDKAIVWLGEYKSEYFNYDDIEIPYYVFDPSPTDQKTNIKLLKNNMENQSREFTDVSGGATIEGFFEITDFEEDGVINNYAVVCVKGVNGIDSVSRPVTFSIVEDKDRDMHLQEKTYLDLLFDSKGRSNDEAVLKRESWSYQKDEETPEIKGIFNNFNWYNNGWVKTEDGTALRISNGASFSIPIGEMIFEGQNMSDKSHTFEFQFKIRNVQSYQNLISSITRYKNDKKYYDEFYGFISFTPDSASTYNNSLSYFTKEGDNYIGANITSQETYDSVIAAGKQIYVGAEGFKTKYTNYDAFLKWFCDLHSGEDDYLEYDVLTNTDSQNSNFDYIQRVFNLSALACGYYSGSAKAPIGFGLGPQDAFFSNGVNTVTASYVEDKMVNLAITYNNQNKLMTIYVNGVLTGVISSTISGSFKINSNAVVFNSTYCDIDLYKFRVYHTPLTINEIVTNYAVDKKDVITYDQNTLVNANDKNKFDFTEMITYNDKHPKDPIMPYIIFDTSKSNNGDRLSWSKKEKVTIGVEFVNTVLDAAFLNGELGEIAKEANVSVEDYYLHHCPSWKGENIQMAVQGTSSEFYPRRNYKLKTKDANKKINMTMHKGPYALENKDIKWFYMDNNSVGTTKFTMKIDFMESSGSYNRGLANLIHNAHSHHPLYYYNEKKAVNEQVGSYVPASSFEEGQTYYYLNHKANPKPFSGEMTAEIFASGPVNAGIADNKVMGGSATYTVQYAKDNAETDTNKALATEANLNKWMVGSVSYKATDLDKIVTLKDLRTNVQGFPVLAFHKKSDGTYTYIGRYNMLTDKGSDETFGFKVNGAYMANVDNTIIEEAAECWEFENNARGFCSFRDPKGRKHLSFNTGDYLGWLEDGEKKGSESCTAPSVVEDFEYRYHCKADSIDIIVGAGATRMDSLTVTQKETIAKDTGVEINNNEQGQDLIYDLYGNWEKAVRWVWSTALDAPFVKKQAEIDALPENEKKQYLIEEFVKVSDNATYSSSKEYYSYKRHLYEPFTGDSTAWAALVASGEMYEMTHPTKKFGDQTYIYDSYEYRYTKFHDELEDHFNLDYLATYFVATEFLELYDSRGKNCMMASWGPMKPGGDYIWFPIFYDMDTQLGINNTGIPSFEFSIDATEEGCFSTNDSVLWNNFYRVYKNQILQKYQQLKGQTSGIGTFEALTKAPFASVERIEKWYESDPVECNSIVMRGQRPLSAINLDEYYKYIAITRKEDGGYLGQKGAIIYDNIDSADGTGAPKGTFYYALQGDRSLSRIQFLKNRMNYIDSWFGVGSYDKSGAGDEAFWGRFRANDMRGGLAEISDVWVEPQDPYYDENGNKIHEFDAEYWLTLTPSRKSYATIIADDSVYREKYTDTPVKVVMTSRENTIRQSTDLGESLFYLLGVETIQSLGDLYKLYITELHTTNAPNLTELLMGYDGVDEEGNQYKNYNTNAHTFSSMPLLQEANLSNIQYKAGVSRVLDFTNSEKLQNFRATGSNFEQINFAPGVALNTLYLPSTLKILSLTEARQLTNLVTNYEIPTRSSITGKLEAKKGLYIEGFTDYLSDDNWNNLVTGNSAGIRTNLTTLSIVNAENLGYDAYKLLYGYYKCNLNGTDTYKIAMTNIASSPYKLAPEGMAYSADKKFFLDNHHYGFDSYVYNAETDYETDNYGNHINLGKQWKDHIENKELYYLDTTETSNASLIKNLELFEGFDKANFKGTADSSQYPNISGIIYIDNDVELSIRGEVVDEAYVRNILQPKYPNLQFFFKTLTKNFTARFLLPHDDNPNVYDVIGIQTIRSGWFNNPIATYGDISESKANYDFHGWSDSKDGKVVYCSKDNPTGTWNSLVLSQDKDTYDFYAIFTIHSYIITFYDGQKDVNGNLKSFVKYVPFGDPIVAPAENELIPSKDDSQLEIRKTYKFTGWARSENGVKVALNNYRASQDYQFYALFEEDSVYNNVLSEDYFTVDEYTYYNNRDTEWSNTISGYRLRIKDGVSLNGKITLPNTYNGKDIIMINFSRTDGSTNQHNLTHVFWEDPKTCNCVKIEASCFSQCENLVYYEFTSKIRVIGSSSFNGCGKLAYPDFSETSLFEIEGSAFNSALTASSDIGVFIIPGTVRRIAGDAFAFVNHSSDIQCLQFGSHQHPTYLTSSGLGTECFFLTSNDYDPGDMYPDILSIRVYYDPSNPTDLIDSSKFVGKVKWNMANAPVNSVFAAINAFAEE